MSYSVASIKGTDGLRLRQQLMARGRSEKQLIGGLRLISPILLFVVLVTQLWVRLVIIEKGYQLEQLRTSLLHEDAKLRELRLVYAYQTRPAELSERAISRLNLAPTTPQFLRQIYLPTRGEKLVLGVQTQAGVVG